MSDTNDVCLILRPGVTREDFEKAAARSGFSHYVTHARTEQSGAYTQIWIAPNLTTPTTGLHYYEDPVPNFSYLVLTGLDASNIASRISREVPVYSSDELLDFALNASDHNQQIRAINQVAIGFVRFDPTAYAIIMTFARQAQNPLLRQAAVNSITFRAWPHFRPLLERIVADDPAENVRQHAARILANWPHSDVAPS